MARKLPWLNEATKKRSVLDSNSKAVKRRRTLSPDVGEVNSTPMRKDKARNVRNPSSSPPPSPPKQEFMKDGLDADDIWVMVEDEFLATAKLFTQHLHHAEYQRMKKIARSQNVSAINNIARPVDGRTQLSTESKMKIQANAQRRRGQNAITNTLGSRREDPDSEEDDPWMRDPRLAGLMTHRENSAQITAITGVKPKTRASEGYSQTARWKASSSGLGAMRESPKIPRCTKSSPWAAEDEAESNYDYNDRDTPSKTISWPSAKATRMIDPVENSSPAKALLKQPDVKKKAPTVIPQQYSSSPVKKLSESSSSSSGSHVQTLPLDFDEFADFPRHQTAPKGYAERMAKRKAEAAAKKEMEGKRKSLSLEEIPTFLF